MIDSLVQDYHLFDLKGAIAEFNSRMKYPSAEFLKDLNGSETTTESPKYIS